MEMTPELYASFEVAATALRKLDIRIQSIKQGMDPTTLNEVAIEVIVLDDELNTAMADLRNLLGDGDDGEGGNDGGEG